MPAGHESPSGAFKPQTGLRESAAVDAVYHYDLPCEKANQENPQIFLICKYKNNFSDEFAQSNAEGI